MYQTATPPTGNSALRNIQFHLLQLVAVLMLVTGFAGDSQTAHAQAQPPQFQDRDRLEAFLSVTGFDTALESITLSAGDAPLMLGRESSDFGADWSRTVTEVFDLSVMRDMALDILGRAMTDELLNHAVEFYASDLGQRLVAVENAAHMVEDKEDTRSAGEAMIADLLREGAPRLAILQRMGPAIDPQDSAVRAVEEIQIRFLLSASAAGVVDMQLDEAVLRNLMEEQRGALRLALQESALVHAAYVYQDFTDAELETYVKALEHPDMQKVYELMNAIQYEIMANRFEVLAGRMADLHPGEDL
ncbi:MAG: DUF2059 domain-containing protein [Paracoccaceae bacterium]|uniref:DUF2059 domain-containing protein n=1 Tax=Seohaeicola saemankumensis TaxID=481181 RepID=UPI001E5A690C|nr:DUF2059 domain-containing protein [Seohaeicola saemankumensis]MCD1626818.1 DUF2059 domain-containing protein [Seohaeicola saemankumensis]